MSEYSEYFLNSASAVAKLEMLEISHPDFTQTHYLVRNHGDGVTVTHEDATSHDYIYCPMKITDKGDRADLDQGRSIVIGDVGTIFTDEVDNMRNAGGFATRPTVTYRAYRSDDLSAPMLGPISYEMAEANRAHEGLQFDAMAPRLNLRATGELYTTYDYPSLKGFLS